MLRSPGTASPFAPPVEDLIDLRGVRAFARRERLGQIEERVPRQIPFPRRPFGESLSCGLVQGEPFGLRGPQDERIDHGIHLRLDDLLPTHQKGTGAWTIYMFSLHVATKWRCGYRQEQRRDGRIGRARGGPSGRNVDIHDKSLHCHMKNLQVRVDEDEIEDLDELAQEMRLSRSEIARSALRECVRRLRMEKALARYLNLEFTLSRAAHYAGVPIRDMADLAAEKGIPFFRISLDELRRGKGRT